MAEQFETTGYYIIYCIGPCARTRLYDEERAKASGLFNHFTATSCTRVQKLSFRTQNIVLASNGGKHNSACKHLLKHWRKKLRIQYKENNFYFINRGKWPQPDPPRLPRGLKHTCTHRNTCTRSCAHIHGGDTCVNHLLGTISLYTRKKKKKGHSRKHRRFLQISTLPLWNRITQI